MPCCRVDAVTWKNRRAYRLSNGVVELTVLLGGGHLVDFRLCGSPVNALWEAPWPTIEPEAFSLAEHLALYGEGPVGKLLSGYSGHALALGYFGMPTPEEAAQGLALHGEAVTANWNVVDLRADDETASLAFEVELPVYHLHFQRTITLRDGANAVRFEELVRNRAEQTREFQWVEHAAFGEPLFAPGDATLFLSATRGLTWPLGYEGHEMLPNDTQFEWPAVLGNDGTKQDLSAPFACTGTGFVASLLVDPHRDHGFIAVHNRRLALVAGYVFERARFPWIALWEENRARTYPPWNGITRVRGVEFGNSPMPLGLEHAREMGSLWDAPVLTHLGGQAEFKTSYEMFLSPVPSDWTAIREVQASGDTLILEGYSDPGFLSSCRTT